MADSSLGRLLAALGGLRDRIWKAKRLRGAIIVAGIGILPFGLVGGTSVGLSMQPDACASCHEMQPFYQQWQHSTHKEVICVDCHTEPGASGLAKMVGSSVKNTAEHLAVSYVVPIRAHVSDESCLRCHERDSRPEVIFESSLRVAHSQHEDVPCADCHGRLVHTVGQEPIPSTFLTHQEDTKTCNVCHTAENSPHGPSRVDCASCHSGDIPGHKLSAISSVPPRENCIDCHTREHVAPAETCQTCHISPHGIDRTCNTCHTSTDSWSEKTLVHRFPLEGAHGRVTCNTCHTGGVEIPVPGSAAAAPVKGEPAPSNASQSKPSAECKSCHTPPDPHFGTECGMCHQPTAPFKKS